MSTIHVVCPPLSRRVCVDRGDQCAVVEACVFAQAQARHCQSKLTQVNEEETHSTGTNLVCNVRLCSTFACVVLCVSIEKSSGGVA